MRFLDDGADIPDDLLRGAAEGRVVFLCGAGVSHYAANMPLFDTLTDQIYDKLGEIAANEYAEQHAIDRKEFDRALRSLEKRTHRPRTDSRVRTAVVDILDADDATETPASAQFFSAQHDWERCASNMSVSLKIKTPKDVTDFEREQLPFFLARDDLAPRFPTRPTSLPRSSDQMIRGAIRAYFRFRELTKHFILHHQRRCSIFSSRSSETRQRGAYTRLALH